LALLWLLSSDNRLTVNWFDSKVPSASQTKNFHRPVGDRSAAAAQLFCGQSQSLGHRRMMR
jgi:hypothetical protein